MPARRGRLTFAPTRCVPAECERAAVAAGSARDGPLVRGPPELRRSAGHKRAERSTRRTEGSGRARGRGGARGSGKETDVTVRGARVDVPGKADDLDV